MAVREFLADVVVYGDITGVEVNALAVNFDILTTPPSAVVGSLRWNQDDTTLDLVHPNGVIQQIGQEQFFLVKNQTGVTIPDGTPVMFTGTIGASSRILVTPAIADGTYPPNTTVGIMTQSLANGGDGFSTWFGKVRGIDTTGTPVGETWAEGDVLYTSATTAGELTNVEPTAPNLVIANAVVINVHATTGSIIVRPTWTPTIESLSNVNGTTALDNYALIFNAANDYWDPQPLTESLITDLGPYDNYLSWDLKVNGTHQLDVITDQIIDLVGTAPIVATYSGSGVVTFTHLNTNGNKHIPAGGSIGEVVGWDSDGTGQWVNIGNTNTLYEIIVSDAVGVTAVINTNYAFSNSAGDFDITFPSGGNFVAGAYWDIFLHDITSGSFNITNTVNVVGEAEPTYASWNYYRVVAGSIGDYSVYRTTSWGSTAGTVTSVTAGTGMTQTGTSTINPTLNVEGGHGIIDNANDIDVDYNASGDNVVEAATNVNGTWASLSELVVTTDSILMNNVSNGTVYQVPLSELPFGQITSIGTSTGLDGGGTTGTVTISLDLNELPTGGTLIATDTLIALNGSVESKQLISTIPLGIFNNDQGWTTNTGDITNVTAGVGLSGGGSSGSVTLTLDFGELGVGGTLLATDYLMAENGGVDNRQLISSIPLGIFNNDQGWTSNAAANDGTITISAGSGLTTGGAFTTNQSANETISTHVGEGYGILVGSNDVAVEYGSKTPANNVIQAASLVNVGTHPTMVGVDSMIFNDDGTGLVWEAKFNTIPLSIFSNDLGITAPNNNTITLSAGVGVSGGGAFTVDQSFNETITFTLDFGELAVGGTLIATDYLMAENGGTDNRQLISAIPLGIFDNDQGWTSATGTMSSFNVQDNGGTQVAITNGEELNFIDGNLLSATVVNQTNPTVTFDHDAIGPGAATYGSTSNSTKIDQITIDASGHITAITTGATGSGSMTSWNVQANGGTASAVSNAEEVNFINGVGTLAAHVNQTNPTITFNIDYVGTDSVLFSAATLNATMGSGDYLMWSHTADGNTVKKADIASIELSGFDNDSGWTSNIGDITQVSITTSTGLDGTLNTTTGNHVQTISLDFSELPLGGTLLGTDWLIANNAAVESRQVISSIPLGIFNNDQGWTSNAGTVTSVTVSTGLDITNGTTTPNITVDLSEFSAISSGVLTTADYLLVLDGTVERKITFANMELSLFNNDSGWTSNTGDITNVSAGDGMTGGGASGSVTLNVVEATGGLGGAAGGITVNANNIHIDYQDTTTNNIVVSAEPPTSAGSQVGADTMIYHDASEGRVVKDVISNMKLSSFNNDSGWTGNTMSSWTVYVGGVSKEVITNGEHVDFRVASTALTVTGTTVTNPDVIYGLNLANVNNWSGQQYFGADESTISTSTLAWNCNTQQTRVLTMTYNGTTAIANATGHEAGGVYVMMLVQGANATSITWGNEYRWPGGVAPDLTPGTNSVDIFTFYSDANYLYGTSAKDFS